MSESMVESFATTLSGKEARPSHAVVRGQGPHHAIMLNGWFGRAGNWGPFADCLDADRFTWHFFEYRGYGTRRDETGVFSLAEIAGEVVDYVQRLEAPQVSVVGHSMGAVIMQRVLLDMPTPPVALVGISPVPASGTPLNEQQRTLFESAATKVEARGRIINLTTGNCLPATWVHHLAQDSWQHTQPHAVGNYLSVWADCDFASELGVRDLPILLLTGDRDPVVTVAAIESAYGGTYPGMQVGTIADTGHYAMFEHPVDLAARVMGFLDAAAGGTGAR